MLRVLVGLIVLTGCRSASDEATQTHGLTGAEATKYKYTGKEQDATGLYYYGARYYDPNVRRFMAADSVLPDLYDPQQLNRYAYVRNNPIKLVDPNGHEPMVGMIVSNGTTTSAIMEDHLADSNNAWMSLIGGGGSGGVAVAGGGWGGLLGGSLGRAGGHGLGELLGPGVKAGEDGFTASVYRVTETKVLKILKPDILDSARKLTTEEIDAAAREIAASTKVLKGAFGKIIPDTGYAGDGRIVQDYVGGTSWSEFKFEGNYVSALKHIDKFTKRGELTLREEGFKHTYVDPNPSNFKFNPDGSIRSAFDPVVSSFHAGARQP